MIIAIERPTNRLTRLWPHIRPNRRILLSVMVLAAVATAGEENAHAQDVQRIAAVVNEKVISVFDVQQRMQILISSSGLPNTRETQRRIGPQVLRGLIDEALQKQEADRLNIRVNQREIDEAVSRIEQQNRIPAGGFEPFLQQQGISVSAAIEQIRTNIAWQKLLSRTVVPTIEIGDDKIDDVITRVEASHGVTESRVGEILLPVDNPTDTGDIRALAERLVEQLRGGADFRAVAQQFSKSATAAIGGDIGWVQLGELETAIDTALTGMKVGEISEPLTVSDGIQIITLIAQRTNAPPDQAERRVKLRQLLLPTEENTPQSEVGALTEQARTIAATVNGCEAFATAADEAGTPQPPTPAEFQLKDLNAQLRGIASTITVGQVSEPLRQPGGIQLLMVCERQENAGPNRGDIRETLLRERVGMLARRYLRDLRRAAFVDLRV